jgi:hypothetical protein
MNTSNTTIQATTALPPGYSDRLVVAFQHPKQEERIAQIDAITDELVTKGVCRPRGEYLIQPRGLMS